MSEEIEALIDVVPPNNNVSTTDVLVGLRKMGYNIKIEYDTATDKMHCIISGGPRNVYVQTETVFDRHEPEIMTFGRIEEAFRLFHQSFLEEYLVDGKKF